MKIEKIIITGLYGCFDKTIDFYKDVTLLVGINGSGKTSILNIINWLLKPSIPHLCVTEYKTITLTFSVKGNRYEIFSEQNENSFTYHIKSEKEEYTPLTVRLLKTPNEIKNDETLKLNLIRAYAGLRPDQNEKKTWDLVSTFPNPTVIGLDRNLYAEESDKTYIEEGLRSKGVKRNVSQSNTPLERVKEIVNLEYRKKKNSILNLTNELKNHLMLSAFAGSITIESFSSGIKHKLNINQIEAAEKRVFDYFQNFERNTFDATNIETVSRYFSQLRNITSEYQKNPKDSTLRLLYGLNANQFIKIKRLLKEFEKFEEESNNALVQINTYIETLNFFFKDSAKKIVFKEDIAELSFHTLDKNEVIINEFRDIKFLSSGEQQILILFSYIAFSGADGRLFIIDEPEISLHIKWQEDFLEQLERITPKDTQLIFATHSPILVNKKKNRAKLLLPYNE